MALSTGTRIGPYEIVAALGAGGMGEVYRAKDTRLDRLVALKILPASVAGDADRQARFEREARAIARLNHPHILALYDVGHQDGTHFIVTELVEGEPVRGPMPVRRLAEVGAQIADGLAAAHAAAIVHRDLKPDNILLTRDGRVKILDFGLARDASGADGAAALTMTSAATSAGLILGTVSYMSPEQARGQAVDTRSDQFSLGLVLYELASGRKAFARDSVPQTLSAIIEADPDMAALAHLPAPLRWIIERCLAKSPDDRYGSTADLFRDLRQVRDRQSELTQSGVVAVEKPSPRRRWLLPAMTVLALAAIGLAARLWFQPPPPSPLDRYRFVPAAVEAGVQSMPAWSPDGQSLAYSGEVDGYYQIFVRQLGQSTPSQLTNMDADCIYPAWDAAGTRVFFEKSGASGDLREVWVVSTAGGAPERVTDAVFAFAPAPDSRTLYLVKPAGAAASHKLELWARDLGTNADRRLIEIPGNWTRGVPNSGTFHVSPDGALVGLEAAFEEGFLLLEHPLDANAAWRQIEMKPASGGLVSLSDFVWLPDSRRIVTSLRDPTGGDSSIWIGDTASGVLTRVTASSQWETTPAASPDGSRVAFSATPLDWDLVEVDLATGRSRPLVASARYDGWGDWMPDGSGVIYSTQRTGRFEIWMEAFRDGARRAVVTPDAFPEGPSFFIVQGTVSPDSRSVAYVRFSTNQRGIYVSALAGSRPVLVSGQGDLGRQDSPAWSPDGRWIVFRRLNTLMKTLASGQGEPTLFAADVSERGEGGAVEWAPDGKSVIYASADGLRQIPADGGETRLVTTRQPVLWDLSPDGRVIYAIAQRERRAMDLVAIDVATGAERTVHPLGQRPLTPVYSGYLDTLRSMRISPDGTRVMYATLRSTADIWILEGINGR